MTNTFKLNEEEIRSKSKVGYTSLNNIFKKLHDVDSKIKKAYNLINDCEEIGSVHYESIDKQIMLINNESLKYDAFKEFANQYKYKVDNNYSKEQERVCNDLGDIVLENIQIRDTLGISHPVYTSCEIDKDPLIKLKDLLSYGEINTALKEEYDKNIEYLNALRNLENFDSIEWPEGTTAEEIEKFKVYIQSLKENELDSFEDEISNFLTYDKIPFITKGEEFSSIGLDLIPIVGQIKGLCEAISGEDLVTRREFSTLERWLIFGTLILDGKGLYSVGKAATSISIKEGGKQALKYTGRQFTKEFAGGVTFYGASSIASELGVSPKGQLAVIAGIFVFGNKGTIKAGVETANARLKGVSKNSLLDNLRLADKNTYDSIMKNLETSTRKNTVSLSNFGAGELQRIYDNNASLRAAVKDFDELSKCIGSLSEVNRADVYKILSGTDSKKIAELSDVIKGANGDNKKINEYLSGLNDINSVSEAQKLSLSDFSKEVLKTKPMNSPQPEKWLKKGGSISIDKNDIWTYTNKAGQSVSYPNGYPDFTNYMHPTIGPVEIKVSSPKNPQADFKAANEKAGLNKNSNPPVLAINKPPEGYTWHHYEDGKTMILVDEDIHREFRHIGGQSTVNGKNKKG